MSRAARLIVFLLAFVVGVVVVVLAMRGGGSGPPSVSRTTSVTPRATASSPSGYGERVGPRVFGLVGTVDRLPGYRVDLECPDVCVGPARVTLTSGVRLLVPAGTSIGRMCSAFAVANPEEYGPCFVQALLDRGHRVERLLVFWTNHGDDRPPTSPVRQVYAGGRIVAVTSRRIRLSSGFVLKVPAGGARITCPGITVWDELGRSPQIEFRIVVDEMSGRVRQVGCLMQQ